MKEYDIAIIGAGIHGAAVALEAAEKGLSVVAIERRENAGLETSSASSKLIHGGLRYLETGQVKLVYECLNERRRLLKQFPELVNLRPFLIPVYKNSQRSSLLIACGLLLYWILSGFKGRPPFMPIAKSASEKFGLKQSNLTKLFTYLDAQTDDKQLTQATLARASALGAQSYFGHALKGVERTENGYRIQTDKGLHISARVLVNAAGPWVNLIAEKIPAAPQLDIEWVQGTHLVLNRPALDNCIYCEAPSDLRAVFVLPWKNKTLVGTTEKIIPTPNAQPSEEEIHYLLATYNHYFPNKRCESADILEVFSGVRVLPKSTEAVNNRSRDTLLLCDNNSHPSYVAIYGGKLTSHRATARRALKKLMPTLK